MNIFYKNILFIFYFSFSFLMVGSVPGFGQEVDGVRIKSMIESYKNDIRGPYKDLRWFCPDGTFVLPRERCSQPGGVQRARYKDEVASLHKTNHLFLGQILATTGKETFWDEQRNHSRLKQYQLGKYLQEADRGWILRRAQFYRGAVQAEDEEAWGVSFFTWLLGRDNVLKQHFFLVRQALKDIPHRGDDNSALLMRSQSQSIAESYPPFMDLRVKIHGRPQKSDIEKVRSFRANHAAALSPKDRESIDNLLDTMVEFFQPMDIRALRGKVAKLSSVPLKEKLADYTALHSRHLSTEESIASTALMLFDIRRQILSEEMPAGRMMLLDISNALEAAIFRQAAEWNTGTLVELLGKTYYLSLAAAGAGYVEQWEWERVSDELGSLAAKEMSLDRLNRHLQISRSQVEWGTEMVKAVYGDVITQFSQFEPLAGGFLDDRIRSSVLLPLGQTVNKLGDFIGNQSGSVSQVMGIPGQNQIRGLNPGFAVGELQVVAGSTYKTEVSGDNIYIFDRPPADLKPVAGIATVSEGSLVSHIQLLARSFGIPNAIIGQELMEKLKQFSGERVFYAVSNGGTVIMKPESEMTDREKALFLNQQCRSNKITVPVDEIRLDMTSIVNLRHIKSSDSGKLAGPKSANLGQLKLAFPDNVVEGFVIPFGIFYDHMQQPMPGRDGSYWQFLNEVFRNAAVMSSNGSSVEAVEDKIISQLEILRKSIKNMPLRPSFLEELDNRFESAIGSSMGTVPVFLRSDTNMEDLEGFSGAGLNLTLLNVRDADSIKQGIKDIWASPYEERSFRWRQKVLSNPENVYPSVLVIPSVDVDYSGVIITRGINSGNPEDITVAFSRGAGGAVSGQTAESYLVKPSGEASLLAPSREPYYNRLPDAGGIEKRTATFEQPILNEQNIGDIIELVDTIRRTFPQIAGYGSEGPYDVELGFKDDKLWLFQVRPVVENKEAVSSGYLQSISPDIEGDRRIKLSTEL